LLYTKISGKGEAINEYALIKKDVLIQMDTFAIPKFTACRHANGRDWWIIHSSRNTGKRFTYLFSKDGISLYKKYISDELKLTSIGQVYFTHEGDKYIVSEGIGSNIDEYRMRISVYDFDRCTGDLDLVNIDSFPMSYIIVGRLGVSPSGEYIYVSNRDSLFQYEVNAVNFHDSRKLVGLYDGFRFKYNEFDSGIPIKFGAMAHGPDGKIYISPEGGSRFLHTIEYPDEDAENCNVRLRSIYLLTSNFRSIPNFPHYRLGPLDGSPCDTLGLDNHPIAKFRYEADTTDHLNVRFTDLSYYRPETWHWDFGDGTTFSGKKPYFHSFPSNGVYNVCLTVSNENSENTSCRLVTIGTSAIENEELEIKNDRVSIFPNPTDGEVLLTLSDYIPEHGVVEVYDAMGKLVHKQRVYYGWNNVDLKNFASGSYHYIVKDGSQK
jgi:hypothetical protein